MGIHLILLAINEVNTGLTGSVHIYSDCFGALDKVKKLSPSQIPTGSAHSDVLKNILVNCSNLSFNWYYSHVDAHQDDCGDCLSLSRPSQLNCSMDSLAKKALWDLQVTLSPSQQAFPLKPICIFACSTKITADMGDYVCFWTHRQLAWERFQNLKILTNQEFDYVDWEMVYEKL
jgi:hypothetical protein